MFLYVFYYIYRRLSQNKLLLGRGTRLYIIVICNKYQKLLL